MSVLWLKKSTDYPDDVSRPVVKECQKRMDPTQTDPSKQFDLGLHYVPNLCQNTE